MAEFEPIPYRIRIGVTGHRNLGDTTEVEACVQRALKTEVEGLFTAKSRPIKDDVLAKGTTPILYRVLSPLAEGADRAVARGVLAIPGSRLDAVLPLSVDDYLEDFETEASKQEFRDLLAICRQPVLLRKLKVSEERCDPEAQKEMRRESYEKVGQYVVDRCDVLFAIWDGLPSRGRGGTAEVVTYALEQNRPVIRIWEGEITVLNPGKANNGLDASAIEGIDRFNRLQITEEQKASYAANLKRDFFEKPQAGRDIPQTTKDLVTLGLFPYYAQASIVAKQNQKLFHGVGKYAYTMSAAAVGCAAFGVLFPSLSGYGFGAELVLLILIAWNLRKARKTEAHERWIENRFLTERIRCGVFMAICGVEPKPIEVLPYMGHSQTVNDWPVRVLGEIWDRLPPLAGCSEGECLLLNSYVQEAWICDQVKFHKEKKDREGKAREQLERRSEIVLPIVIGAASLHLLLLLWRPEEHSHAEMVRHVLHTALAFIALLFPAIAASLAGMEAHREHLRLEKRSENMGPQLERLNKQMASAKDPERFENLLQKLDEMMLREAQDWLMLMRFVEIKAG